MRIIDIPLDLIRPREGNRSSVGIDEERLGELTASIAALGVLQPISVVRRSGGHYELVGGERRWRACLRIDEIQTIPALVMDTTAADEIEIAAISENIHRADIHPLDEAAAYATLVQLGVSAQDIARRIGRSVHHVQARLLLERLVLPIRRLMVRGRLGVGTSELIARLPRDHQERIAERISGMSGGGLVTSDTVAWWVDETTDLLDAAPFDRADAELTAEAPACTECPKRLGWQATLWDAGPQMGERCGDRSCWQDKVDAHVAQVRQGLHGGGEVVEASSSHSGARMSDGKLISPYDYEVVPDGSSAGEGDTTQILVVDGPQAGTVHLGMLHTRAEQHREEQAQQQRDRYEEREAMWRRLALLVMTSAPSGDPRRRLGIDAHGGPIMYSLAQRLRDSRIVREELLGTLLNGWRELHHIASLPQPIGPGLLAHGEDPPIGADDYHRWRHSILQWCRDRIGSWSEGGLIVVILAIAGIRPPIDGSETLLDRLAAEIDLTPDGVGVTLPPPPRQPRQPRLGDLVDQDPPASAPRPPAAAPQGG